MIDTLISDIKAWKWPEGIDNLSTLLNRDTLTQVPHAFFPRLTAYMEAQGYTLKRVGRRAYERKDQLAGRASALTDNIHKEVWFPKDRNYSSNAEFYILTHELGHTILTPDPLYVSGIDMVIWTMLHIMPPEMQRMEAKVELFNYFVREMLGYPTDTSVGFFHNLRIPPEFIREAEATSKREAEKFVEFLREGEPIEGFAQAA